ncbi:MAG: RecX family transcriptional regulator [Clostridia bacterium]|nr:RecX family transcriptional regulator [Clostridia bacterium]
MGVITKIEVQRNKKRASVFIDNAFFCGLMVETVVANRLKVGQNVDEDELKRIIVESETKRATEYLLKLISGRIYSKSELLTKLKSKGYDEEVAGCATCKLEEYGYIDDEAYAKTYVEMPG